MNINLRSILLDIHVIINKCSIFSVCFKLVSTKQCSKYRPKMHKYQLLTIYQSVLALCPVMKIKHSRTRLVFRHLKTGLVQYSDPSCKIISKKSLKSQKLIQRQCLMFWTKRTEKIAMAWKFVWLKSNYCFFVL